MSKDKEQPSIWAIIRQIISFIFQSRKAKKEKFEKASKEIKEKFENIDKKYNKEKNKKLEDRLNNMF